MANSSAIVGGERGRCSLYLLSADMNVTTDQIFTSNMQGAWPNSFVVRRIIACNASGSLTTAVGGIYTGAGKTGDALVANTQAYSGLTNSAKIAVLTLAAVASTDAIIQTVPQIYLSLTTAQGAAMTCDIYIFGDVLAR